MSGYLRKNLDILACRQPELAHKIESAQVLPQGGIETTRSGMPGLKIGKVRLSSTVDPVDEGIKLSSKVQGRHCAIFGFGLGYHIEPLLERDIVVYEPDERLLKLVFDLRDFSELLPHIRLETDLSALGDLTCYKPFIHRPTARLYPEQACGFERRLTQRKVRSYRNAKPRVLVVPPILGGTVGAAYWSCEALAHLGCNVKTLPIEKIAPLYDLVRKSPLNSERLDSVREPMVRFLGEVTLMEAEVFQPDLVLALAQAPLQRRIIASLRKLGAKVAFWFVEDYRLMTYYREVASSYDHFFHIQGEEMARELDFLGANHSYLPVACHPPCHRPLVLSTEDEKLYSAQVGFMGAGYPNRLAILGDLVQKGMQLKLWGVGWPDKGPLACCKAQENRYLDSSEVVKIYNACEIVLNLHSSPRMNQRIGGADFVNPRTLEVPCCGAFQLVDNVKRLSTMLKPGKEVAVFNSRDELLEKVDHYLKNPDERARIAQAGRRKVLNRHTYYHRMESMLTQCLGPLPEQADLGEIKAVESAKEGPSAQKATQLMLQSLKPEFRRAI